MGKGKVLVVGANGYVGCRLVNHLVEDGQRVVALVRSKDRFIYPDVIKDRIEVIECDLLDLKSLEKIPDDIKCAFYLVHSLSSSKEKFYDLEATSAHNFRERILKTGAKKIVYLSGLSVGDQKSEHMRSRHNVTEILGNSHIPLVTFKAGIIIGAGSASFELMRDLVEKLPVMIAPRWVSSKCQPIGIVDVLYYLTHIVDIPLDKDVELEIGGQETLTYKEMLYRFAKMRGLKRLIISVPVLTPRLSSYWLYFVTSSNMFLAKRLIESLKTDAVCSHNEIDRILPHKCMSYEEALHRAFDKIEQNHIASSWKDALNYSRIKPHMDGYINVPEFGCLKDKQQESSKRSRDEVISKIWSIGGKNGWYYWNWAWRIRGYIDKAFGGVGLRRGRRNPTELENGDSLDFWRVIKSDKENGHLLLYAEMKVPGEAWLEWFVEDEGGQTIVRQIATFRPKGIAGRLYWYAFFPFHLFIFKGLCRSVACIK